jgi:hypothetical protein
MPPKSKAEVKKKQAAVEVRGVAHPLREKRQDKT